jgi:hypothetical protein
VEGLSEVNLSQMEMDECVTYSVVQRSNDNSFYMCYCGNSKSQGINRSLSYSNRGKLSEPGARVLIAAGTNRVNLIIITSCHGFDSNECNWDCNCECIGSFE